MQAHFRYLHLKSFSMVSRSLQSNEFWPLNSLSKNLGLQLPKWESTWGCVGKFPHTFSHSESVNVTPGLHFWPTPFYAFILVMSPRLGSWQHLKVFLSNHNIIPHTQQHYKLKVFTTWRYLKKCFTCILSYSK
jgi:hypothetical protein